MPDSWLKGIHDIPQRHTDARACGHCTPDLSVRGLFKEVERGGAREMK